MKRKRWQDQEEDDGWRTLLSRGRKTGQDHDKSLNCSERDSEACSEEENGKCKLTVRREIVRSVEGRKPKATSKKIV